MTQPTSGQATGPAGGSPSGQPSGPTSGLAGKPANDVWSAELAGKLDGLLRQCIQCGLCLPVCATYLATGNEVQSPRGRLLLLGEILVPFGGGTSAVDPAVVPAPAAPDTNAPVRSATVPSSAGRRARSAAPGSLPQLSPAMSEAFDLCLGCRACETACPSGVSFELLAAAKELATARLGTRKRWLTRGLSSRGNLRHLRRLAQGARTLLAFVLGTQWRTRLERVPGIGRRWARRLGTLPTEPPDHAALLALLDGLCARQQIAAAEGRDEALQPENMTTATGPTVAFFRGCVNDVLLPGAAMRLRALLVAAGCRVVEPPGLVCCGALDRHTGRPERADALRARNVAILDAYEGTWDNLVVEAAGCGLELRSYSFALAKRVKDGVELLSHLKLPPARRVPLKVVVHDPCHARHGQGIVDEPRQLLRRIPGLILRESDEQDVCCGSGGAYSLLHPELSAAMGKRKAELLAATGADLIVTANPGCLGQLADALCLVAPDLPVLPLTDLLWYAHLGGSWTRQRG